MWREQGIVPSIIATAVVATIASWWYSRKVQIEQVALTASDVRHEAAGLLRLGVAFMASGFLTLGAAYAVRIIVLRWCGVDAAGLYQAAWALGGLYVGFILQAMGADFYPRLTAVAHDSVECNRLVNEQAHVSLLLAGPGVICTITVAPLVLAVFYSHAFAPAVDLLRWICLGMTLRVVAFPMGFIVLARGARRAFFWTEVAATIVHAGLAWLLVAAFGLSGAGAAFFGLYVWHGLLIYWIVHRMTGFEWSPANRALGMVFVPLTLLVFLSSYVLAPWVALAFGLAAAVSTGVYSLKTLVALFQPDAFPRPMRPMLLRLGMIRAR